MSFSWSLRFSSDVMGFGEDHINEGPFSSHFGGTLDLLLMISTLITWPRWCLPDFSTIKSLFPILYSIIWKQVTKSRAHSRAGEEIIKIHLLQEGDSTCIIWNSLVRFVSPSPSYYSITYFYNMDSWIGILYLRL